MNPSTCQDRRQFIRTSFAAASASFAAAASAAAAMNDAEVAAPSAKPTYLVIYRAGPAWPPGSPLRDLPLRAHGRYMLDLFKRGALRFAGPFTDDSGGAVMFEAEDDDAARLLVEADPAVTAQLFTFQLHRWSLAPWADIAARA